MIFRTLPQAPSQPLQPQTSSLETRPCRRPDMYVAQLMYAKAVITYLIVFFESDFSSSGLSQA